MLRIHLFSIFTIKMTRALTREDTDKCTRNITYHELYLSYSHVYIVAVLTFIQTRSMLSVLHYICLRWVTLYCSVQWFCKSSFPSE